MAAPADVEDGDVLIGTVDGEPRDERVADPCPDETLHGAAVVGPEHDLGIGALAA